MERSPRGVGPYHLNMYAIEADGAELLMTRDHVHPQSKGGLDTLDNLQTMCTRCNRIKGDSLKTSPILLTEIDRPGITSHVRDMVG